MAPPPLIKILDPPLTSYPKKIYPGHLGPGPHNWPGPRGTSPPAPPPLDATACERRLAEGIVMRMARVVSMIHPLEHVRSQVYRLTVEEHVADICLYHDPRLSGRKVAYTWCGCTSHHCPLPLSPSLSQLSHSSTSLSLPILSLYLYFYPYVSPPSHSVHNSNVMYVACITQ